MARLVSIHEYELKAGVDPAAFEQALHGAEASGLFKLPGLVDHHFVRGFKGARAGRYAAVWVYESREAWQRLWGTPERPRRFPDYPAGWQIWESDILAPFLDRVPDTISFTVYDELETAEPSSPRRNP